MKNDIYYRLDQGQQKTTGESAEDTVYYPPVVNDASGGEKTRSRLCFWRFPGGHGSIQPWRRRLWELQNYLDRE
ncbi:hypothetical protein PAECIP111892_05144 [Paenibacillus auburnensis]|uniref:Uncharacterized protein n=1 Tax=Paenibacillus auburnensis TaxID=2905649 RepID=A0ABN8H2F9_9BACL|nr:hypothetical protein [Paenibacillus auburnensis]CAH1222369.1 hypothetical protein PAECIP111892_05144 [Paenibacillus auburnensis]